MSSVGLDYADIPQQPLFRPFTRESLAAVEARQAEKLQKEKEEKIAEMDELYVPHREEEELHPDETLEAGKMLPKPLERGFPPDLIGTPIEDFDKYYEKVGIPTFVVVSKGKDIFRFSATKALFILSPFNPIRRVAIFMLVHPWFSFLVIVTILVNCILMTMQSSEIERTEIIFTTIYTFESCLKVTARGLILTNFTYLRDPWNWLDFVVIALAYLTMLFEDLGNLSALRTFRVLRALKTVAVVPGLKTIVGALIEAAKNLKDVTILTCFSLSVFALLGLQIYMGALTQKCILHGPRNMTTEEWFDWCNDRTHWLNTSDGDPILCSNTSGATLCNSTMSTCIQGFGPNPNYGYTNYDTFPWALLSAFRLLTQDYWESLYQMILRTTSPWHIIYFIGAIFLGSIYLVNLILAIVAMSYDELQKKLVDEDLAAAAEEAAYQDTLRQADVDDGRGGGGGGTTSMAMGGGIGMSGPISGNQLSHPSPLQNYNNSIPPHLIGSLVNRRESDAPPSPSVYSDYDDKIVDEKDRVSLKSNEEDNPNYDFNAGRINGNVRKASLSLPGSPYNVRRGSRGSQFSVSWARNSRRVGDRKPLVLQTFLDAQEHLPYADDSAAATPMSEENGAIIIPVYTNLHSRHSSYTSHSSRISYTSHGDIYGRGIPWTKESQLLTRRNLPGFFQEDMYSHGDDFGSALMKRQLENPFIDSGQQQLQQQQQQQQPQQTQTPRHTVVDIKDVMVLNDIIDQAAGRQSKSSERVSIYYFPTDKEDCEEEKPSCKQQFTTSCLKAIDIMCVWDCCWCWVRIQELFALIVFDPFMELFITLCIVVNTLFMAMDHHNMDPDFEAVLKTGNLFFSGTFAIEAFMKLIAISPKFYFREGWNVFDFIIVALSLLEIFLEGVRGLSVLRSFRLLRVFKLAKSWPTLNLLITIMGKTLGDLGNLTFVLAIIVFIFAVMGMQLFGANYSKKVYLFPDGEIPRWNFKDFMHSFMIVFRVLCGEWIESMWDCMLVCGFVCVPFFLATVIIGHLVMLNLFLALLLSSFGASNLSSPTSESADTKKLQEAFDRFGRAQKWLKNRILTGLKQLRSKTRNQIRDTSRGGAATIGPGGIIGAPGLIGPGGTLTLGGGLTSRSLVLGNLGSGMDNILEDGDIIMMDGLNATDLLKDKKLLAAAAAAYGETVIGPDGLEYSLPGGGKITFKNSANSILNSMKLSQAVKDLTTGDKLILTESELIDKLSPSVPNNHSDERFHGDIPAVNNNNNNISLNNNNLNNVNNQNSLIVSANINNTNHNKVKPSLNDPNGNSQFPLTDHNHHHHVNYSTNTINNSRSNEPNNDSSAQQSSSLSVTPSHHINHQQFSSSTQPTAHHHHHQLSKVHPAGYPVPISFQHSNSSLNQPSGLTTTTNTNTTPPLILQQQQLLQLQLLQQQLIRQQLLQQQQYPLGEDVMGEEMNANKMIHVTADVNINDHPADCLPEYWYHRFPCCLEETSFWVKWGEIRSKCYKLVEDKYFETLVITLILISSMTLALEDVNLKERPWLEYSLKYIDQFFTIIFTWEMLLKWFAYGFKSYFSNAWCWLDFIIVMVSLLNLGAEFAGIARIQAFKTMRTLRALRPLRAMSRSKGMRVVVNALVQAIPAIFNVLLVCLIFWLIFAIMGVQLFAGKFSYCRDRNTEEKCDPNEIENKTICDQHNETLEWYTPMVNFDHVLNGYLSLFQVATFKGWTIIMDHAIDSREVNQQPIYENSILMYLYFVFFIIFGSFFTLNLFIGVIIDNFNEQKKKGGGSREMLMTEDQKKYLNAMKKMGSKKPMKAIPRPRFKLQAIIFDIVTNKKFDMLIMLFIMLNMFVMSLDHYQASPFMENILEMCNLFFIAVFTAECMLKIFALRFHYFREPWNVFDFVIVILSIASSALKDFVENYLISPTLLRVVRVVKIGRVLRLVKGARGIRTLLFALAMSLPALFNICLLLFLVMFIYAIFGMSFFMNVKQRYGLDETFNFGTFFRSFILLFQMCTSAGWDGVLAAIMDETKCDKDGEVSDCGSKKVAIAYLVTYLIISFLVIVNMYIAVILENYSQATEDVQEGLTDDDYDMYYEIWQRFDPDGTQFINFNDLGEFLDALEEPLRVPKPNKFKIIQMDIPICVNDMCYCVEILDILTREFFARKGKPIEETPELEEVLPLRGRFEHTSSTFWRQREEYCARIIQTAWFKYQTRKRSGYDTGEPFEEEDEEEEETGEIESNTRNRVSSIVGNNNVGH
ncbi:sodium channel protein para-like isoform X3 [Panonychus citri]|uniref:sodium channel protein para-like isoform X3 n=1 Tax=Panonychus citri TaxID=50023 RepID=UPI0023070A89|nr:sodium channel protein para-like isoform X3 [Panonychus citri]